MSAYEALPTPSYADAKGQIASALEFGLFVVCCEWTLHHKDGRDERQFQTYSAMRLDGIEAALREYRHGPLGLTFFLDARELLVTDRAITDEQFDQASGAFVSGAVQLYRPTA